MWIALGKKYIGNKIYGLDLDKNLKMVIKQNLFSNVWENMQKNGERNPPFLKDQPGQISSFGKSRLIKSIYFSDITSHGQLIPISNGFEIKISRNIRANTRIRSVIAHEIGHTFFFRKDTIIPKPYFSLEEFQKRKWEIDGLAYEVGRSILLPEIPLKQYININNITPSLENLEKICNDFEVSKELATLRLVTDLNEWNCSIAIHKWHEKSHSFESLRFAKGTLKKQITQKKILENVEEKLRINIGNGNSDIQSHHYIIGKTKVHSVFKVYFYSQEEQEKVISIILSIEKGKNNLG